MMELKNGKVRFQSFSSRLNTDNENHSVETIFLKACV